MALGIPIITERLMLREFEEADLKRVRRYNSLPLDVPYEIFGPGTPQKTRAFIRKAIGLQNEVPRKVFDFAVVRRSDGRLMGTTGLNTHGAQSLSAETGFTIEVEFWGQGYATECSLAVLAFGFTELNLRTIYCRSLAENHASIRVLEKIGMHLAGSMRQHWRRDGELRDVLLYEISVEEWKASHE